MGSGNDIPRLGDARRSVFIGFPFPPTVPSLIPPFSHVYIDLSGQSIKDVFEPLIAELECGQCREVLNKRVRDVLVAWSSVKVRTSYHIQLYCTDLQRYLVHDLTLFIPRQNDNLSHIHARDMHHYCLALKLVSYLFYIIAGGLPRCALSGAVHIIAPSILYIPKKLHPTIQILLGDCPTPYLMFVGIHDSSHHSFVQAPTPSPIRTKDTRTYPSYPHDTRCVSILSLCLVALKRRGQPTSRRTIYQRALAGSTIPPRLASPRLLGRTQLRPVK